ncbi:hypothetical protein [Rubellicoccus peritrichatus]|uniref:Tetratricopeptide repeat protein n=1 Tax=Rubellicoccus peritrichatus TaxID=3080537 RepID=A0AAQ3QRA3_9BACT|nr:hypothetical protein [Puniceicoccus sp. CR14]WOO41108.1 hypothetical protein RZN69_21010 [Puniceicoccus sp. CR14]
MQNINIRLILQSISFVIAGISLLHGKADETPEVQHAKRLELAVAENPEDLDLHYDLGLAYNELALNDDEDAIDKAIDQFEYILEQDPTRVKAMAFIGSLTVLKARYSSIFTKLSHAEKGFDILDKAVETAPDDPDVRLIRAANSSEVPGFLGRSDEAEADFDWLLANIELNPDWFNDGLRRSVYFYAGEFALKKDDDSAVELLLAAQTTPGASRLEHRIDEALEEARKEFPDSFQEPKEL